MGEWRFVQVGESLREGDEVAFRRKPTSPTVDASWRPCGVFSPEGKDLYQVNKEGHYLPYGWYRTQRPLPGVTVRPERRLGTGSTTFGTVYPLDGYFIIHTGVIEPTDFIWLATEKVWEAAGENVGHLILRANYSPATTDPTPIACRPFPTYRDVGRIFDHDANAYSVGYGAVPTGYRALDEGEKICAGDIVLVSGHRCTGADQYRWEMADGTVGSLARVETSCGGHKAARHISSHVVDTLDVWRDVAGRRLAELDSMQQKIDELRITAADRLKRNEVLEESNRKLRNVIVDRDKTISRLELELKQNRSITADDRGALAAALSICQTALYGK
jgi:hypothetical protein